MKKRTTINAAVAIPIFTINGFKLFLDCAGSSRFFFLFFLPKGLIPIFASVNIAIRSKIL
jgi:hypothetical protein